MHENMFSAAHLYPYRLHEATTDGGAVSRVHIHMFAPQTFWTMVGIPVAIHGKATLFAREILDRSLKPFLEFGHDFTHYGTIKEEER